jgi:hypothetical protein
LEAKTPPMGLLKNYVTNGEAFIKGIMILMLEDVVMFLNIGKTMNAQQVTQTADMILKDFNFLRVEDFKLCFENGKKGFYGKQYDRLDGQVLYEWLSQYASDRANEAEKLSAKKTFENSDPPNIEGQKKVIEILSKAVETFQNKPPAKIIKPDETTIFIQKCLREFDEIHHKNPIKDTRQTRFISYNGKNVDQVEYANLKLEERKNENISIKK